MVRQPEATAQQINPAWESPLVKQLMRERAELVADRKALIAALRRCIERGYSPDVDNGCVEAEALLREIDR